MEFGDSLNVQKSNTRVSMKSKISKVAEFWGAETPFANLGREDVNGMENGNVVSYLNFLLDYLETPDYCLELPDRVR
jgi:hypothetical protein